MTRFVAMLCGTALALAALPAWAGGYSFKLLPANTHPFGVNDTGTVAGYYVTPVYDYGFLADANGFRVLNAPFVGGAGPGSGTFAYDVNDSGLVVGYYVRVSDVKYGHGFLYNGTTWTKLDYPDAESTYPHGVSNNGLVVGDVATADGLHGFIYDGTHWRQLDYPGASITHAYDVNDNGLVVGYYEISQGDFGFLYDGSKYVTLNDPDGFTGRTFAYSINDNGWVAGAYGAGANIQHRGFLFDGTTWRTVYSPLDQGAIDLTGLNNNGTLVGTIDFAGIPRQGYVAVPMSGGIAQR